MLVTSLPGATPLDLLPHYAVPRPYVRAGMVLSADGSAAQDGSSRPLSTPADRSAFRALRALCDVVLVGAGTARAEDYAGVPLRAELVAWRREAGLPDRPRLAVVTRTGRLDPSSRLFDEPPLVVAPVGVADGLRDRAEVLEAGEGEVDLPAALETLRRRGLPGVLCEGGPSLLAALLADGLLDEVCWTVVPRLVGGGPAMVGAGAPPADLEGVHCLEVDGSLLLRSRVRR